MTGKKSLGHVLTPQAEKVESGKGLELRFDIKFILIIPRLFNPQREQCNDKVAIRTVGPFGFFMSLNKTCSF